MTLILHQNVHGGAILKEYAEWSPSAVRKYCTAALAMGTFPARGRRDYRFIS